MLSHELPTELGRLRVMERMLDPGEFKVLGGLPIQPSWHCLELGAGGGSIARWLADRVPAGRVVATDVDTRFLDASLLDEAASPVLEVLAHDVERDDFPAGSFDLIHARALFMHLSAPEAVLGKVVRWLKPGGWLAVSDADIFPVESSPYPVMRLMWAAAEQIFVAQGSDPRWARSMPLVLARAGLVDAGMTVTVDVLSRDGVTNEFWKTSFAQIKPFLLERGLVSEAVYAEAQALVDDPAFLDTLWGYVRCWARRPEG
jgi:SAM-dependent methyltransferase